MFYKFDQLGKGIAPNTPKKEGISLFFDILYREFWSMAWLNVYFILFSLPIFTFGASYAALCSVLVRMIRDKPVDPYQEFKTAFKKNFKGSTSLFCFQIVIVFLLMMNYFFYEQVNPSMHILLGIVTLFLSMANLYLIPILVSVDLPLKNVLSNSVLLSFLSIKSTFVGVLFHFILTALTIWYLPYSFTYYIFFGAVFSTFIICFLTYPAIVKYCYPKDPQEVEEEEAKVVKAETHEEEMARLDAELDALKNAEENNDSEEDEEREEVDE